MALRTRCWSSDVVGLAAGVGPWSANFGTKIGSVLIPSRTAVGRHYGPTQGKTVRLAGPKKLSGGCWRVIDRYQRSANSGVVGQRVGYKNWYEDPGFAE